MWAILVHIFFYFMKIASHDTMTYLPPKKWWLYPFRFMARCQSKSIQEQYENYGIRFFDLRISFDKNLKPEFRHGLIAYKANVDKILNYLNDKGDVITRLIYEKGDNTFLFKEFCAKVEKKYPNIKFCEGRKKKGWEVYYDFKNNPSYEDKYSSNNYKGTTGTILDDWFPWLYARFHNKKNVARGTNKDYLMIDFVHYGTTSGINL